MKIEKERLNNIIKQAENNDYLFSLLYASYLNGLEINNCSNGDKKKKINPYISYILKYDDIDTYRNIISTVEEIPNIIVDLSYDFYNNKKLLTISCYECNRDEVFYKLTNSFDIKSNIKTKKGKVFFKDMFKLIGLDKKEAEALVYDGIKISSNFNTLTKNMKQYQRMNENIIYKLLYDDLFSKYKAKEYDCEPKYKIKEM